MKKLNALIVLLLLSSMTMSQPLVNLLIQIVDENNNPVEGFTMFIKHPNWSQDHWIPAEGRNTDPPRSEGSFSNSFTMNSTRHDAKYNMYSSISGLSDLYSSYPTGGTINVDIKLVKNGYRDITEWLTITNRPRYEYSLIERNYVARQTHSNNMVVHQYQLDDYYLPDISNHANIAVVSYFGRSELFIYVDERPLRRNNSKPVTREFDFTHSSFSGGGTDVWISPGEHTVTVKSRDGRIKRSKKFIVNRGDWIQWDVK